MMLRMIQIFGVRNETADRDYRMCRGQVGFSGFVVQPLAQDAELVRWDLLELDATLTQAVTPYDFTNCLEWQAALRKIKAHGDGVSDGQRKTGLNAGRGIADVPQGRDG